MNKSKKITTKRRIPIEIITKSARVLQRLKINSAGRRNNFSKPPQSLPKARRCAAIFILFLLFTISLLCQAEKGIKEMSYEELVKKYAKLEKVKNFLESDTPRKYAWSMNKFFDSRIYGRLIGNEFFGYYYDEGIAYSDKSNRIAIDTIGVIKGRGYEKYKDIYTRIFLETLSLSKKQTYYVDKQSRFSIGICIVSVKEKDDVESSKGIVLETYIKDRKTGKYFYHRCGTGSQVGLEQAMMFSAARIICNLEYLKQKPLSTESSYDKKKLLQGPRGARGAGSRKNSSVTSPWQPEAVK